MLSILIPSIPERSLKCDILERNLKSQINEFMKFHKTIGSVEVLIDNSKRFLDGGLSIGKKREALVQRAQGKYLCFLDDDESVSPDYIETLMRLCHEGNDVCTFKAMVKMQTFWALVDMRMSNIDNEQLTPDKIVNRQPWHICPVKSVYAKMFEFPDINAAEDFVWMEKVLKCCKTESHTDRIIFQYNHKSESESDKIIRLGHD